MVFYNTTTEEYPRYTGDIQLLYPDWDIDKELPHPWVYVIQTDPPATEKYVVAYQVKPENIDGEWVSKWETRELSQSEIDFLESQDTTN